MRNLSIIILLVFVFFISACSSAEFEEPKTYEQPETEEGIWLLNNISVLETIDPIEDLMDDLIPLANAVGNAQIVGLGEATHGTSEFFRMKHRVFKSLVTWKNFKLYILEQDFIQMYRLNNYIVKNMGSALTWYWYVYMREYINLIEWMHDYNLGKEDSEKIWLLGCDMLSYHKHMSYVKEVLAQEDTDLYNTVNGLYSELDLYTNGFVYHDTASKLDKIRIRADIKEALATIVSNKTILKSSLGEWDYNILERAAIVVIQSEDFYSNKDFPSIRDKYMYDNIVWLMALFNNSKAVTSSHNEHISFTLRDNLYDREWDATGFFLREKHQSKYISIGLTFYEGSFHTYYGIGMVGPPLKGSYEYFFEQAKRPLFYLNLRGLNYNVPGGSWLEGPRRFRHIDERFSDELTEEETFNIRSIIEDFDMIIYIKKSTPYKTD